MRRAAALIAACGLASLASGVSGAAALMALILVRDQETSGSWISGFLVFSTILTLYAAAAMLLLGLPAHAALSRLTRGQWAAYAVAGLVAGGLVAALFGGTAELAIFGAGLVAGLTGATAFWLVARPDRRRGAALSAD